MNKILFVTPKGETFNKAVGLFAERCSFCVVHTTEPDIIGKNDFETVIKLSVNSSIPENGYSIVWSGEKNALLTASDDLGFYYGVGRLLHGSSEGKICREKISAVPQKKIRGIYFATHFHNYYHDAPIEEIYTYMEDLLLWGCNTVAFWFDMHHYKGISDPNAVSMAERLTALSAHAKKYGMKVSLTLLANEYYADSPEELRASYKADGIKYHDNLSGHFHVELCPSKDGALDLLVRSRREMFQLFRDCGIDYICIWPYDQGGCTCEKCYPWGGNGFLKITEAIVSECRKTFPEVKIIISTWLFDRFTSGEWDMLYRYLDKHPNFADYVLTEPAFLPDFKRTVAERGTPGGLPLIGFPEISMAGCVPWGGFGANVKPSRIEALWKDNGSLFEGGFPYSEGIFEDLSKVIYLQLYFGAENVKEIIKQYVSYEISDSMTDEICTLIDYLEKNDDHVRYDGENPNPYPDTRIPVTGLPTFRLTAQVSPKKVFDLADKINSQLTEKARNCWRWKILYTRAECDMLLYENGGNITKETDRLCTDLVSLYHAENAAYCVSPVTYDAIFSNRGDFTW